MIWKNKTKQFLHYFKRWKSYFDQRHKKNECRKYFQNYFYPYVKVSFNNNKIPSVIDLDIDGDSGGRISPKKVFIELYDKGKLIEEDLELESTEEKHYIGIWENDDKFFDKLIVRIQYGDGKEFQKEIWSKDNE